MPAVSRLRIHRKYRPFTEKHLEFIQKRYGTLPDSIRFWMSLSIGRRLGLTWQLQCVSSRRFRLLRTTSEGVMVMKLVAGRKRDLLYVKRRLAECKLNHTRLLTLAREAGAESLLKRIAKQAGWENIALSQWAETRKKTFKKKTALKHSEIW